MDPSTLCVAEYVETSIADGRAMVGGVVVPSEEAEAAASEARKEGVIFVLEGAQLEVAKVGKVVLLI